MPRTSWTFGAASNGGYNRIGDLIFDQVRAAAGPFGKDDDLDIREIRDRVQRNIVQGPDPPDGRNRHDQEDQEPVLGTELNNVLNHFASSVKSLSAWPWGFPARFHALDFAFRINKEIGCGDDLFTCLQAFQDFVVAAGLGSYLDLS